MENHQRKPLIYLSLSIMLAILSASLAHAQTNDELFDYHALNLGLAINNKFSIVTSSPKSYVDSASAELFWYPQEDYRQFVDYINTEPKADFREGQSLYFSWKAPAERDFAISEDSRLSTTSEFFPVRAKQSFPIKDLDPSLSPYLQPQEIIDINDDIRSLAARLAENDDDLYSVTEKLAVWVENNVDYNLSTLTADASQKSSWVLQNRQGVCDELSSLFISMCRSLGIPARFVSGLSYSNVNLQNDGWGPHGWAEVYFPDYGWVPMDVTYKELGYVDATHIKLRTTVDAKETSVEYSVLGNNVAVQPGALDFQVAVKGKDFKIRSALEMAASIAEPMVGLSSYNLVALDVKNPNDYYVAERLYLVNVTEIEILGGDNFQTIVLAPHEEKTLNWLLKVASENPDYIYTYPIKVISERAGQAETSFKAGSQYKVYSEEYMRSFMATEKSTKSQNGLKLTCTSDKREVYSGESTGISCSLQYTGDKTLPRLRICLDTQCQSQDIKARSTASFSYSKAFETLGVKTLTFSAENDALRATYYVIIEVQDKPLISITNLTYPENINFSDQSEIRFVLKKSSSNTPMNIKIKLTHELIKEEWDLPSLESAYEMRFIFKAENLDFNDNPFKLTVSYDDSANNTYFVEKDFNIYLNDPGFFQKILLWINIGDVQLTNWFSSLLKNPQ